MAAEGDLAGLIDMENVAVMGHSYGGYTTLAMAGAQMDFAAYKARCAATQIDDPAMYDSMCIPLAISEEALAERAGLDGVSDGLWPSFGDARVTAIIPMAGDSYMFGKAGLAKITIPMMAIGGTADSLTPYEWGSKPAYDYASSEKKALVTFDGAEHAFMMGFYENMPWLPNTPFDTFAGFDAVWGRARSLDLTDHFVTAFMLAELKGDAEAAAALAPEAVSFPGIEYQAQGYGAEEGALSPELTSIIESIVTDAMEENNLPGFVLSIVVDDKPVYAQGFGLAEIGTDRAMTTDLLLPAASLSKQFTAMAIMQLVEQGKIDLDAPLTDYLPYFKLDDSRYTEMTVRQVLAHISGMPQISQQVYGYDMGDPGPGALEEYVRALATAQMDADPGAEWSYSNIGFNVLGHIVATVSGETYEDYIQNHILTRLGMDSSTMMLEEMDFGSFATGHYVDATGEVRKVASRPYTRVYAPAAGLASNVDDLMRWAMALNNGGELDGARVLEEASLEQMWEPQATLDWGGLLEDYGLAWFLAEPDGHRVVWHIGSNPGYVTAVFLAPDDGIAVVAANNMLPLSEEDPWFASDVGAEVLLTLLQVEVE